MLVTGATGMLGPHLLAAWRARDARPLIALVRATDERAARARLADAGVSPDVLAALDVACGDMTAPGFGLDAATWDRVGTVVHAAATMSLAGDWNAHAPVNVAGTAHLLSIVSARGLALHYVSTLSVFASTDRAIGVHTHRDLPSGVVYGGYAQTKVAGEALVRARCEAGPIDGDADCGPNGTTSIYRLGLLVETSHRARRARGDQLAMTLRGLAKLGAVPAIDADTRLDLTAVEHAADAIVRRALTAPGGRRSSRPTASADQPAILHIASSQPTSYRDLVAPLHLPTIAPDAWIARARERFADADVAMAYLSLGRALGLGDRLRAFDLFLATGADFSPDEPAPAVDLERLVREALA